MSATVEDLDFIAPAVADMTPEDKARALELAQSYRPGCLPSAKQDEAQLWYAAWLLYGLKQQKAAVTSGITAPAGVTMEKEGDLQRTYGRTTSTDDPMGFYAQYDRLSSLCRLGAITTGVGCHGQR